MLCGAGLQISGVFLFLVVIAMPKLQSLDLHLIFYVNLFNDPIAAGAAYFIASLIQS